MFSSGTNIIHILQLTAASLLMIICANNASIQWSLSEPNVSVHTCATYEWLADLFWSSVQSILLPLCAIKILMLAYLRLKIKGYMASSLIIPADISAPIVAGWASTSGYRTVGEGWDYFDKLCKHAILLNGEKKEMEIKGDGRNFSRFKGSKQLGRRNSVPENAELFWNVDGIWTARPWPNKESFFSLCSTEKGTEWEQMGNRTV